MVHTVEGKGGRGREGGSTAVLLDGKIPNITLTILSRLRMELNCQINVRYVATDIVGENLLPENLSIPVTPAISLSLCVSLPPTSLRHVISTE